MCLSQPKLPQDNSAQIAQQQNDQRQAQIKEGQGNIDTAFSKFDQPYFDNYTKTYEDNYNPQVDDQYNLAKQKEKYNFARAGVLDSTPAIFGADQLNKDYGNKRQQIASDALGATNDLKNNVANQKSQLYSQNLSAADPTLAASNATASAGTLSSQPQYSALGDLFSGLVNGTNAYMAGQNRSLPPGYATAFAPGGGIPTGSGSGRVVG